MYPKILSFETDMFIYDNASSVPSNASIVLLSNSSIETEEESDLEMWRYSSQNTARGVCLVIFVAIGTALNVFMIISIVPNRRLRSVRNILLVHLGCTGLLLSALINFVTAVVSFSGKWLGGIILCQMYGFIMSVLTLVTVWTIAALSWDKYQTIASPLHHSLTATAIKMITCFSIFWSVACVFSLPPLLGGSIYVFHPEKGVCFVCTRTALGKVYTVAYILGAFYIPLGIMLYCYTHIFRIAQMQSSRIAATMIRMTCVIQAPIAPSSHAGSLSLKGTKAMCTIFQLIGTYVLTYVPISLLLFVEIVSDRIKVNGVISSSFTMLFLASPVINASVYGLRNKILRSSFHRYIRRKIRHYCYKDKRKNSVKSFRSFRSASFKAAMLHRRDQNGSVPGLRRTQSFPVQGYRGNTRTPRNHETSKQNGNLLSVPETLTRPHSDNILNTGASYEKVIMKIEENDESVCLEDDIPDIDAD